MKRIVTNRLTLLPVELLTDTTTVRATIVAETLSCITTFYYNGTLLLKL